MPRNAAGTALPDSCRLGWRKKLRGLIKKLLPYGLQRAYAARNYGLNYPAVSTLPGPAGRFQALFYDLLPFGLVCRVKDLDAAARSGFPTSSRTAVENFLAEFFAPGFHLPRAKLVQLRREREEGAAASAALIAGNRRARILVILHLFYGKYWGVIREYLANLAPYDYDLLVTAPTGGLSPRIRRQVLAHGHRVRILEVENRGFDLGPLAAALRAVDLSSYDVVIKLHSKGVHRPFLYAYDRIFKNEDWFCQLFDGVLGGENIHRAIDLLLHRRTMLTAAETLLVTDPEHKAALVERFCRKSGTPFLPGYRFVAGTCFAARPELFAAFAALPLCESDFAPSARGTFSAAHALERLICFPAAGAMTGMPVTAPSYPEELRRCRERSALRLLADTRFELDPEFFYRELENRIVTSYEVVTVKLREIRRVRNDMSLCPLEECEPYLYLQGSGDYAGYCERNRRVSGYEMSPERFEQLRRSVTENYNSKQMPVVRGPQNLLLDGQHRCCVLLALYGPEYELPVLRLN